MNLDPHARYLFLFAHFDDDVFVAGTMNILLQQGAELHCAWLTSGDYFGQGNVREKELDRVMSILGLPESHVHRLGFPDLGLVKELGEALEEVTELMTQLRPDTVFATAYEGGHPDHDAVNFLASEGSSRAGILPELYEFPLYNGAGKPYHCHWRINSFATDEPRPCFNRLDDAAIRCKHRIIRTYSSQWMYMVPARLSATRRRLSRIGEPYRPCPRDRDYTTPPHKGTINYERWFNSFMNIKFRDFSHAVTEARSVPRETAPLPSPGAKNENIPT